MATENIGLTEAVSRGEIAAERSPVASRKTTTLAWKINIFFFVLGGCGLIPAIECVVFGLILQYWYCAFVGSLVALVSGTIAGLAWHAESNNRRILDHWHVEHSGLVVSFGRDAAGRCMVTFADDYVAKLDFVFLAPIGRCGMTIWRDGWGKLKKIEYGPV